MSLNPSPRIRLLAYVFTAIGSVVVGYLSTKDLIGDAEVGLWAGIVTVVTGMAGLNISDK